MKGQRFLTLLSDESGSTIFSVFWVVLLLALAGLAVDPANAWRHRQFLQQTADVSAHAAVVALAKGANPSTIRNAAKTSVSTNLDEDRAGNVLADPAKDIEFLSYDPFTNTARPAGAGPTNAVLVRLKHSRDQDNAVPLTFLRIAYFMGLDRGRLPGWEMTVEGVVAWASTSRCRGADMIVSGGSMNLTAGNSFNSGYCVHGQEEVWMPQNTRFKAGASVSMPNLTECRNKCTDKANPGASSASNEMNLLVPDIDPVIDRLLDAFVFETTSPEKSAFFAERSGLGNLSPLSEIGYPVGKLQRSSVVHLSQGDFSLLTAIPHGLVYDVSCDGRNASIARSGGNGGNKGKGQGSNPNSGGGNGKTLSLDSGNAGHLRDVAIITDCALALGNKVDISQALLVSTAGGLSASSQAHIGAAPGNCKARDRTTIMVRDDIRIPGNFSGSNTSYVTAGSLHMAGAGQNGAHHGVSMIAEGDIHISAGHDFKACATDAALQPPASLIRHVEPRITR